MMSRHLAASSGMPSQRQEKPMTERVDEPVELTFERDVRPLVVSQRWIAGGSPP
jgi:hypothetical protein